MNRLLVGAVLASAVPALAQAPAAARLSSPVTPLPAIVRGAEPDPFQDGPRPPAARLGVITSARIGEAPDDATPEERYNWGAPRGGGSRDRRASPASRTRDRDDDRDDDSDRRGARLREPTRGRLTNGQGPPPPADPGAPTWWPTREQDLNELRDSLPAFGDQRGGGDRDRDRLAFGSDCAFDNFISPITNPFLAEDPRALTELRLLYLYQTIPTSNPYYGGGSASFFGVQGRVAFTDRFSVVVHKLGWLQIAPSETGGVPANTGFSEIWLGPKFVFWRDPDNQSIASFGLQFQLPTGPGTVFQDTGTLGLVPYISYGRELGRTTGGTFRMINVGGYSFSTGTARSDYFFDTLHVDLDVGDMHRFYPVLEASWFHYTTAGTARPSLPFEGRDLANIGGQAAGRNLVTLAPGFRYKFTEFLQFGVAAEFPIAGSRDLFQFRLNLDLIWRY